MTNRVGATCTHTRRSKTGDKNPELTHPSGFGLVLERLLRVLRRRLHVVDGVLDVVHDAVDHLTLKRRQGHTLLEDLVF